MIQWFPGHMAKARGEIEAKLKLVDIVFVLLDARIPYSSQNPMISDILKNKARLILLTKSDMADPKETKLWTKKFNQDKFEVLEIDSISGLNINKIVKSSLIVLDDKIKRDLNRGLKRRPIRAMIVGIPNVGKSTLINRLVNKKVARVANRPGVTVAQQWVRINEYLELLDTPGVLWPKFEDQIIGMHLALTGAIKDDILKTEELGIYLLDFIKEYYPSQFKEKYNVDTNPENAEIIKKISLDRGLLNDDYYERCLDIIINDFRNNRIARMTLDRFKRND